MTNFFDQQKRMFSQYPAVTLLIGIILFSNVVSHYIGSVSEGKDVGNLFSTTQLSNFPPTEWFRLITSTFIPTNRILILLLIVTLLIFGPLLEKIFGAAKFTLLFLLPVIIGGAYLIYYSNIVVNSLAISVSGLLGVCACLILKRNYMITKNIKICFWLTLGIIFLLVIIMPNFPISEIAIGFSIGFVLSLIVKPQSFGQLYRMKWGPSLINSAGVLVALFFILYSPRFIAWPEFAEGIPEQVNEWIAKIDIVAYKQKYLEGIGDFDGDIQDKEIKQSVQIESVQLEPISKNGDGLYNSILQSLLNLENVVNVSNYTTDSEKVFNTLQQIINDHPAIFYFDQANSPFWSNGILELSYKYSDSEIQLIKEKLNEKVQVIFIENLTNGQNDFDKVKALHDYVVLNTAYDYDDFLAGTVSDESHTIVGTLLYSTSVCEGYAKTMQYLLNQSGIENMYVTGKADGGLHAWNKVKIDGYWYNLDVTWDDPVPDRSGSVSYRYFLVTDQRLARDHRWEENLFPEAVDSKYMYISLMDSIF